MANMNNWLGFSLSPQDHPGQTFNSDEISTNDSSCFDLPSDSSIIPSLNLPAPPFGILEAFNRNNHSQDWNMNINPFSCSSNGQNLEDENRPKLENFMGVHHQEQQKSSNYEVSGNENSYNNSIYQESEATSHSHSHSNNNNSSTIGLSMITNWLRNNPAPAGSKEAAPPAAQTLSLSMSTGSHSSSPLPSDTKIGSAAAAAAVVAVETAAATAIESVPRKSIDTFGQRTSIYRGVTRHRWTGRYEAHLWDNSCRREGQTRKGRQVYLGGYDKEDKAARAYDLAALKYWGTTTTTNFPMSNYEKEIEEMKHMTRQEYVASLRRKSSGFSRGASMYRGVTRHHQHGRWQARIGRVAGNKDLYLGTFSTEEEAAEAYDIAAIKFRGLNAVTNFEINRYDVKSILESSSLPIGGAAKRLKDAEKAEMALRANESSSLNLLLTDHHHHHQTPAAAWPTIAFQPSHQSPSLTATNPYSSHQRLWCKQEQDYHGFMQQQHHPNSAALHHNIMGLDSSNPNNNIAYGSTSAMNMNMNMNMMMGTVIVQDGSHGFLHQEQQEGNKNLEYEAAAMFGSASADARNFYSSKSNITTNGGGLLYDQGSTSSTNWIPTAVPTRTNNNMAAAATFTVWNDT